MRSGNPIGAALCQQEEYAIILLDTDARVVGWLPGATKTFGWTPEEMIGQTLARIFTQEDIDRGDLEWEFRTARSYGTSEDDRWQVRKDAMRIWVTGIVTALRDDSGDLTGFCKICRDRTDIRNQLETLQSRFNRAAQTEMEKHVMLGTLAHELRNPLAPLRSAADLIRMSASDKPQVVSYVAIIERQIRFIDEVLKDLLESTRVGLGKVKLDYARFDLGAAIDAALETCSAILRERGQRVEVLIPERLVLEADAVRLQQVIVNMVSNSSKFSPPGSPIWIKATVDGQELVLRVEDKGRGIPSEVLPSIFEFFTQSGPEGADSGQGLGLGLGLVKSIVEMHGGTVQARSEGAGKGAEVIVRLPLRQGINSPLPPRARGL